MELASLVKFKAAASAGIVEKGQLDAAIESPSDIPFRTCPQGSASPL
jgi:hypothetical protein